MFYPTSAAQTDRDAIGTNSFNQGITHTRLPTAPFSPWPTGGETPGVCPNVGGVVIGAEQPAQRQLDSSKPEESTDAAVERQLRASVPHASSIRVSYLGAHKSGQILGIDLAILTPNDIPFGTSDDPTGLTGIGDGQTPCDPSGEQANGPAKYSLADLARMPFPLLGDYILGYRNVGHSNTKAFRPSSSTRRHTSTSASRGPIDQNSSGMDMGNSSLAGDAYNGINPNSDYGVASWVSHSRLVSYGVYDLPIGRGQRFAANASTLINLFIGGWQITYNMFAKSGVWFTPFLDCTDCDPVVPGNVATGAMDAVGDFGATSVRPLIISDPRKNVPKGYQWNPAAFALPSIGADLFTQANVAKRNSIVGPGGLWCEPGCP